MAVMRFARRITQREANAHNLCVILCVLCVESGSASGVL